MSTSYVVTPDQISTTTAVDSCPDDNEATKALIANIPPVYQPSVNTVLKGLLTGIGLGDCTVRNQIGEFKDQMFVATADHAYLDRLGANVGVPRPNNIGLNDANYRQLIPIMSYVPKQIRQSMAELLKLWYGDIATHANVTNYLFTPFVLVDGTTLTVSTENADFTIDIKTEDYQNISAATVAEVVLAINKQTRGIGLEATAVIDPVTFLSQINLRTTTQGATGSIQVTGGSANAILVFPTNKATIATNSKPAVVYEVAPNELVVMLPTTPTVISRGRRGSMYIQDADKTQKGPYVYDPKATYSISSLSAILQQDILAGDVHTSLTVDALPTGWPSSTGYFILDFGTATEEGPIKYITAPNSTTLVISPSYVFKKAHTSGVCDLHFINKRSAPTIASNGSSYATYITGTAEVRQALQDLIAKSTAIGVKLTFVVLKPKYRFSNPSFDTNESP